MGSALAAGDFNAGVRGEINKPKERKHSQAYDGGWKKGRAMNREVLIKIAIQELEGNDFDRFACELLSRKLYPGLNPTSASGK